MNTSEPEAIYRYRIVYRREKPAIWLAHLDMMRTFERALRRAKLPLSFSQGFNPRPRLVFALPIGVGMATEDDCFELWLTQAVALPQLIDSIKEHLPAGLAAKAVGRVDPESPSLMSRVVAADYRIEQDDLAAAWQRMSDQDPSDWIVDKKSKGKIRPLPIAPLIEKVTVLSPQCLQLAAKAGSRENLRPDLFLQALSRFGSLPESAALDANITRSHLWLSDDQGRRIAPLADSKQTCCDET